MWAKLVNIQVRKFHFWNHFEKFEPFLFAENGVLVSTLQIENVRPKDAGTYTCSPSNARNHSVVVHVIKGELTWRLIKA